MTRSLLGDERVRALALKRPPMDRRFYVFIVLITILAAALRLWGLQSQLLWGDDYFLVCGLTCGIVWFQNYLAAARQLIEFIPLSMFFAAVGLDTVLGSRPKLWFAGLFLITCCQVPRLSRYYQATKSEVQVLCDALVREGAQPGDKVYLDEMWELDIYRHYLALYGFEPSMVQDATYAGESASGRIFVLTAPYSHDASAVPPEHGFREVSSVRAYRHATQVWMHNPKV